MPLCFYDEGIQSRMPLLLPELGIGLVASGVFALLHRDDPVPGIFSRHTASRDHARKIATAGRVRVLAQHDTRARIHCSHCSHASCPRLRQHVGLSPAAELQPGHAISARRREHLPQERRHGVEGDLGGGSARGRKQMGIRVVYEGQAVVPLVAEKRVCRRGCGRCFSYSFASACAGYQEAALSGSGSGRRLTLPEISAAFSAALRTHLVLGARVR